MLRTHEVKAVNAKIFNPANKRNKKPVPSGLPSGRPKKRNSMWSQIVTTSGFKFFPILLAAFEEPVPIPATAELGWPSPLTDQ